MFAHTCTRCKIHVQPYPTMHFVFFFFKLLLISNVTLLEYDNLLLTT
jgi:hypothetical protein